MAAAALASRGGAGRYLLAEGTAVTEKLGVAGVALEARTQAGIERSNFDLGPRTAFVARLNALRLTSYGQIAELPYTRKEDHLPADFAGGFFLRESRKRKPTIAEVEADVLRLRDKLQGREALLAQMIADEEAAMQKQEDTELTALHAQVAEAERAHAAAEAKLQEAMAKRASKS